MKIFSNVNHSSFCTSFGLAFEGCLYDSVEAFSQPDLKAALSDGNAFKVSKALAKMRMDALHDNIKKLFAGLKVFQPTVLMYGMLSRAKALAYSLELTVPAVAVELQMMYPTTDTAPAGLPKLPFGWNKLWFKLLLAGADEASAPRAAEQWL